MKDKRPLILLGILGLIIISLFVVGYYLNEQFNERIGNGNFMMVGNGDVTSQEREMNGFDSVVLNGVANINIHPSEDYKVVVTTDSNIQDNIIITTKNNSLQIFNKMTNLQQQN